MIIKTGQLVGLKSIILKILYIISPKLSLGLQYWRKRGHWPNFETPKDICEIMISKMASGEICKIAPYVDKLEVRKFIENWGLGKYLPKLYGVWDKAEDIDFDSLPNAFALKTNHGVGGHYICHDKSKLNKEIARERINKSLKTNFGVGAEKQYGLIRPKCFAEEYIIGAASNDYLPFDYKFFCCDGTIRGIMFCSERSTGAKLVMYDTNWNRLDFIEDYHTTDKEYSSPQGLEEMCKVATEIAQKFEYVRVDLYAVPNGKIYIGELTFTSEGGHSPYLTNEAIKAFGHLN